MYQLGVIERRLYLLTTSLLTLPLLQRLIRNPRRTHPRTYPCAQYENDIYVNNCSQLLPASGQQLRSRSANLSKPCLAWVKCCISPMDSNGRLVWMPATSNSAWRSTKILIHRWRDGRIARTLDIFRPGRESGRRSGWIKAALEIVNADGGVVVGAVPMRMFRKEYGEGPPNVYVCAWISSSGPTRSRAAVLAGCHGA